MSIKLVLHAKRAFSDILDKVRRTTALEVIFLRPANDFSELARVVVGILILGLLSHYKDSTQMTTLLGKVLLLHPECNSGSLHLR